MATFPEAPSGKHERFGQVIYFLSQVCPFFLSELKHFPSQLLGVLNNYYSTLHHDFREKVFASLVLLRNREQIPALSILPLCFKLFRVKDKVLRKQAFSFIISDLKRVNKSSQNYQLNKQLQGFIYNMISDANLTAAKKSLHVLMTLYTKRVWNDPRTVNVIANSCLLKEPKLVKIGCTFLLTADTDALDSDSEEDERPSTKIVGSKKTKGRIHRMKKAAESFEKLGRKRERKKTQNRPVFLTIDQLNDPQGFIEKVFENLKRNFSKGKFDIRVLMLQIIARVLGRHKLSLPELYTHLEKYISPKSRLITNILIVCAESTHELTPPEELHPLVKKLIHNFISEHCTEEDIVMGFNTIRELSKRQPLVLSPETLEDLSGFKNYRNKGVVEAACALVNLYKEIKPSMLKKKQRLQNADQFDDHGAPKVHNRVPGIAYLEQPIAPAAAPAVRSNLKSSNLQKLEELLLSQGHSLHSQAPECPPTPPPLHAAPTPELPLEYDQILTNKDFRQIKRLESEAKARLLHRPIETAQLSDSDADNPHGFLESGALATFKQRKEDKLEASKQTKKFEKKPKKGGKTNREHAKSKPMMMLVKKKKKASLRKELSSIKKNIRRTKQQLGKVKKRFGKG